MSPTDPLLLRRLQEGFGWQGSHGLGSWGPWEQGRERTSCLLHPLSVPWASRALTTVSFLSLRWEGLVLIILYVFYILIMK